MYFPLFINTNLQVNSVMVTNTENAGNDVTELKNSFDGNSDRITDLMQQLADSI